jgi:hypothetical protein
MPVFCQKGTEKIQVTVWNIMSAAPQLPYSERVRSEWRKGLDSGKTGYSSDKTTWKTADGDRPGAGER